MSETLNPATPAQIERDDSKAKGISKGLRLKIMIGACHALLSFPVGIYFKRRG